MSQKLSVIPGLEISEVSDGLVVYDSTRGRVHYLNASASVILMLCDGTRDHREIVEAVQNTFPSHTPVETDVDTCITQLQAEGIVDFGE